MHGRGVPGAGMAEGDAGGKIKERKGKERKGKERKGKERKGKQKSTITREHRRKQTRTEQNRSELNVMKQNRAEQNRTERTEHNSQELSNRTEKGNGVSKARATSQAQSTWLRPVAAAGMRGASVSDGGGRDVVQYASFARPHIKRPPTSIRSPKKKITN